MENSRASCGVRLSVSVFRVFRGVAESSPARVLRRDRVRGLLRVVKEQLGGTAASLSVAGIPSTVVFGVRVPAAAHASGCALEKHPCNRSIPGVMDHGPIIAQSTDAGERRTKPLCGDACVQFDVWRAGGMANGANRAANPIQSVLFAAMKFVPEPSLLSAGRSAILRSITRVHGCAIDLSWVSILSRGHARTRTYQSRSNLRAARLLCTPSWIYQLLRTIGLFETSEVAMLSSREKCFECLAHGSIFAVKSQVLENEDCQGDRDGRINLRPFLLA